MKIFNETINSNKIQKKTVRYSISEFGTGKMALQKVTSL